MSNLDYIDRLFSRLNPEIQPCPFCGWAARFRGAGYSVFISCGGCGTTSRGIIVEDAVAYRPGPTVEEACHQLINEWNRRYNGSIPITDTMEYKVQNTFWRTREGRTMRVCDMTTDHIRNYMRMLGDGSERYNVFVYALKMRGEPN